MVGESICPACSFSDDNWYRLRRAAWPNINDLFSVMARFAQVGGAVSRRIAGHSLAFVPTPLRAPDGTREFTAYMQEF
jgi:hypothetical protein